MSTASEPFVSVVLKGETFAHDCGTIEGVVHVERVSLKEMLYVPDGIEFYLTLEGPNGEVCLVLSRDEARALGQTLLGATDPGEELTHERHRSLPGRL